MQHKKYRLVVVALVAVTLPFWQFSFSPNTSLAATSLIFQDGLNGYTGTTDTDINTYSPTTNTGTATTVRVGSYGNQKSLLRFDLSSIPANATINSATLSVYIASNNDNGGSNLLLLNRVLKNWQELQSTWNVFSTGNSWTTAGLGSGTDYDAAAVSANVGYLPVNVWADFPVTSMVQSWVNGTNPNYGVIVHATNGPRVNIDSSEYADGTLRPKLTIDYSLPTGGDTEAPSIPTSLSATAISASQIDLSWTASTDNVSVVGYRIFRNNIQVATSSGATYSDTGLAAATTYSYAVAAFDAGGNVSVQSSPANATTQSLPPTDTITPTVPTNLSASSTSTSQINLYWTASTDNVGVAGYKVFRSGVQVGTSTVTTYADVGLTASTTYSYAVAAFDAAGNVSAQSIGASATTQTGTPPSGSFTFTATGDIGAIAERDGVQLTTATLQSMAAQGGAFVLALGDLSYNQLTPETAWCDYVKGIFGQNYPFELEVGNHENGSEAGGPNGYIENFIQCLPDRLGATGTYGRQYYFDYPSVNPLGRFIMLPAGESAANGGPRVNYENGSAEQQWLNTTIDAARASGIKWIVVGMHMLCPTIGEKGCQTWQASPGPDLFNFLVNKKVDLILHGHEHSYQRSKQFALSASCPSIPVQSDATPNAAADLNCIVDSDDSLAKGAGTVIVISGITPNYLWPYNINWSDPEAPYFKAAQNNNYGYTKVTISSDQLTNEFVRTGETWGNPPVFSDSFTITDSGTPPPSVDVTPPSIPSALLATPISSSHINLSWTASTDDVGVAGYKVFRSGVQVGTSTVTTYADVGLTASTTYSYAVAAFDAAGNVSAQSIGASATTQAASGIVTITLQNGGNYLGAGDTYVDTNNQNTNYGGATTVRVGAYGYQKLLTRFDLSSIPANATINSATLSLYIYGNTGNGGGNTLSFYRVLKNWQELQATWNKYESATNWSTAGMSAATDYATPAAAVATVGYSPTNVWMDFPITALVQGWVNGTLPNNGGVVWTSSGPRALIYSSEYATDSLLRPKLTVTYTAP